MKYGPQRQLGRGCRFGTVSLMAEKTTCGEAVGVEEVKLGLLVHRSVEYTRASHRASEEASGVGSVTPVL